MSKVQHISGISKRIPFERFDFYDLFRVTFENSELGRMKRLLPLREMAVCFGLVSNRPKHKHGPKLLEQLNGNVHYQMFCDVSINPLRPLANYKLIDKIISALSDKLKVQQQQDILAEA